jgi:FAD/FMN-containing dehydrogenase
VEPGIAWEELNKALKKHRLFYPSTPGSGRTSSVGGSVANGGSGMRTVKYGTIRNYVLELKVVLPDGEIVKLGSKVRKTSCGYDLKNLFIGCEGTLGVIAEVTLRLCTLPQQSAIIAVEFEDWDTVKQTILHILKSGIVPSALELTTAETLRLVAEPIATDTVASLLIELHGSEATVRDETQRILQSCSGLKTRLITNEREQERMWKRNGEIYFKLIRIKPSPIAEDLGVPIASVSEAVRLVSCTFQRYGIDAGIMSHAGDGTIHCVIAVDERDEDEWERALRARGEIYRSVIEMNGTITAEHGLGLHRSPFAAQELGASLNVMRRVKRALDPRNIMNPGKMALGEPR